MDTTFLTMAEESGLWLPPVPGGDVVVGDGYVLLTLGRHAAVERIRLGDVDATIEEVRRLARERDADDVRWWIGELTTPAGLADDLLRRGFEPDPDQPTLVSLVIEKRPAGESSVDVRRVDSFDDYLRAVEIDWEVWDIPADEREERRAAAGPRWESLAGTNMSHYLAYVDEEPAGFGRVVFAPAGGLLMGGSVLPHARGRGVYTALVHARWDEAVERGTPRLIVGGGVMSAPILERLGFERIGAIRVLLDRL